MKLKENWWRLNGSNVEDFLRAGPEGRDHPSRLKVLSLLAGMTSVLDVGCGLGVMFELLKNTRPDIDYLGVDVTEKFIGAAQKRFPADTARFKCHSLFRLSDLGRTFDGVICRHILEHLPDYSPALQHLYESAGKKLIIVFYLPPTPLRWRRKKDERFEKGFYTHTYDLGYFMDYLIEGLSPPPQEIRVHPRQGYSDRHTKWGDRQNVIYEVIRPSEAGA